MHRRIIPLVPPLPTSEPSYGEPQSTLAHPHPPDLSPPSILTAALPSSVDPRLEQVAALYDRVYLSRSFSHQCPACTLGDATRIYSVSTRFSRPFSVESRKRTYGGACYWSVLSFLRPFNCIWTHAEQESDSLPVNYRKTGRTTAPSFVSRLCLSKGRRRRLRPMQKVLVLPIRMTCVPTRR